MSGFPYKLRSYKDGYNEHKFRRQRQWYDEHRHYGDQYYRGEGVGVGGHDGGKSQNAGSFYRKPVVGPKGSRTSSQSPQYSSLHKNGNSSGESSSMDKRNVNGLASTGSRNGGSGSTNTFQIVPGTNLSTGENEVDGKFSQLMLHNDFQRQIPFHSEVDPKKNYKVVYDPETDKTLSKSERKQKRKKIRFDGETLTSADLIDPRKSGVGGVTAYLTRPFKKSKKFPFRQLPQPKFLYDKDSLGPPPQTELVVWDLPVSTSEVYLTNFFKSYGDPIKDFKFINDPMNAVPLGIATFKFVGNPEKSMRIAKNFISYVNTEKPKIDGVELKIALNDRENKLLNMKIEVAQDKLILSKRKRDEEEKKRLKKQQQEAEELKRLERQRQEKEKAAKQQRTQASANQQQVKKYQPNTTILSIRHQNKVLKGSDLPRELEKHVKSNPYIFINSKYVPTRNVSAQDIKKFFNKYDWTRVIPDKTGFIIVFNSLKECERCFYNEDGRRFFEYRTFMELTIPEGFDESKEVSHLGNDHSLDGSRMDNDIVEEATNMLTKELQTFLAKDIRERIIAPLVLDLLSHDKYPKLVEELKANEAATKKSSLPLTSPNTLKENAVSLLAARRNQQLSLPSFKKKNTAAKRFSKLSGTEKKRNIVPMQHALNYANNSDESDDEDESSSSNTPMTSARKMERSPTLTSLSNEEGGEHEAHLGPPTKKHKVSQPRQSILYESSSDEEAEEHNEQLLDDALDEDKAMEADEDEDQFTSIDEGFQPTFDYPKTVYPEDANLLSTALDLNLLQTILKDEEDLTAAEEALAQYGSADIKNVEYWAWREKDRKSKSTIQEISEGLENIRPLSSRFESKSGAFRSEKFRKIPDADKGEYLPHRQKLDKPIKTVQHEEDNQSNGIFNQHNNNTNTNNINNSTNSNTNTSNNNTNLNNGIQSSRVNRANNRRLAADISAQKQMLGSETDILNLNALTKRKKPVSFARSAIHNWGLYALEPIAAKEMIIEYVGESIRQQVAEHREKSYLKTGIGSSYLFRIDENTVIDATKKGGIARFINHCCNPSCTAKIIKVEGKKRIVIYALRDIDANEELTYDYKFERETNDAERIRCLCGAPGCKGYLN